MKRTKNTIMFVIVISVLVVIGFYQNCSKGSSSDSTVSTSSTISITVQPVSQTVSVGQYVTLYVTAKSSSSLTYQWYKDGALISSATNNYYIISSLESSDLGAYYVVVSNGVTTVTSSSATLSTSSGSLAITSSPYSHTVTLGQSITLSVTASSPYTMSYQWYKDSTAISGATSSTYYISSISSSNLGSYYVIVSDSYNSVTSSSATLSLSNSSSSSDCMSTWNSCIAVCNTMSKQALVASCWTSCNLSYSTCSAN